LEAIAALKPSSLDELAAIKGVGPTFVERYGDQVLNLVDGPLTAREEGPPSG
jgi:hypothetical protein